jgi:acyl carrier protein
MSLSERMAIEERLEEVVRALFNDDEIVLEDDLVWSDVPGWDSLAHVNLVFSVEQTFGVEFDDEEVSTFVTVGDLKRALQRGLGN